MMCGDLVHPRGLLEDVVHWTRSQGSMVCQKLQAQGRVSKDIRQSLAVLKSWVVAWHWGEALTRDFGAAVMASTALCKCCSTMTH